MQRIDPQLRQAVEDSAERKGAHVIDLVVRGERGTRVVEVFIDTLQGVTSELCSDVSREVAGAIEAGGLVDGAYRLNISSPGIERPLQYSWQYPKHVGRLLQVSVRGENGVEKRTGRLLSADDAGIAIDRGGGHGVETIPFGVILEAVVKAPW